MGDQPDELYSFSGIPPFLHCALAAAQCIVIGPVCLCVGGCVCVWVGVFACGWVCLSVGGSVTTITRNCVQ